MTELETKLEAASKLHSEVRQAQAALAMKTGQLDDLMKEIFTKELGIAADAKEIPLPELLMRAHRKLSI